MHKTFLVVLLALVMGSCSGGGSGSVKVNFSDDNTLLTIESALSSINGALNDAEQINSYAARMAPKPGFSFINTAEADACSLSRFSPTIGAASCAGTISNRTVLSQFNSCTAGPQNEFVFRGTVALTFDAAATCNTWIAGVALPTSGDVVRTTTDFERSNPAGTSVKTSSDTHQNYLGASIGGGVKTTFGNGTRTIDILGLHRNGIRADGTAGFDHSVYTTQALVVSGTKALGNRQVTAGTVKVDHNGLQYSVTAAVSGLKWISNCCYPTEGSITWALSGANSGNLTVNFSTGTCGSAQVSYTSGATDSLTLLSCE